MHKSTFIIGLIVALLLPIVVIVAMVGYKTKQPEKKEVLTLDIVQNLMEEKKQGLNWSDFENYQYTNIGTGFYIYEYKIDKKYKLQIGGGDLNSTPDYMYLIKNNDKRIDIRHDKLSQLIID